MTPNDRHIHLAVWLGLVEVSVSQSIIWNAGRRPHPEGYVPVPCESPWVLYAPSQACFRVLSKKGSLTLVDYRLTSPLCSAFEDYKTELVDVTSEGMLQFILENIPEAKRDDPHWIRLFIGDDKGYWIGPNIIPSFLPFNDKAFANLSRSCIFMRGENYYPAECHGEYPPICERVAWKTTPSPTIKGTTTATANRPIGTATVPTNASTAATTAKAEIEKCAQNKGGGCQHTCTKINGTHTCGCNPGFVLSSNKKTCDDINECTLDHSNGGCQHICNNTAGGRTCSCRSEYELYDEVECRQKPGSREWSNRQWMLVLIALISPLIILACALYPYLTSKKGTDLDTEEGEVVEDDDDDDDYDDDDSSSFGSSYPYPEENWDGDSVDPKPAHGHHGRFPHN